MELKLTEVENAIVSKLTKVEKDAFVKLSDSDKKAFLLTLSMVDVAIDENKFADVSGLDSVPTISVATDTNPLGVKAGFKFTARLLGYENLFSEKEQPNWEQVRGADGKIHYRSGRYKFLREDGSQFAIYDYAQLHLLKRIPTAATDPARFTNPEVMVKYIGLVVGKEKLSKEYGIEIKTGTQAHVFTVMPEKGVEPIMKRGIHNSLNSPIPTGASADKDLTEQEIAERNWNAQLEANVAFNNAQRAIENNVTAQVTQ